MFFSGVYSLCCTKLLEDRNIFLITASPCQPNELWNSSRNERMIPTVASQIHFGWSRLLNINFHRKSFLKREDLSSWMLASKGLGPGAWSLHHQQQS